MKEGPYIIGLAFIVTLVPAFYRRLPGLIPIHGKAASKGLHLG